MKCELSEHYGEWIQLSEADLLELLADGRLLPGEKNTIGSILLGRSDTSKEALLQVAEYCTVDGGNVGRLAQERLDKRLAQERLDKAE